MKKFIAEFKEFALKGNVMDMAIGVIVGGAFKGIVDALSLLIDSSAGNYVIVYALIAPKSGLNN